MPATLPGYVRLLADGFKKDRNSAVQRTPMEDGMVKQLKKVSRVLIARSFVLEFVSNSDYNSFITFFQTSINYGADWFNFTDPEDSVVKLARIVNGQLNQEMPIFGIARYRLSCQIETWSG